MASAGSRPVQRAIAAFHDGRQRSAIKSLKQYLKRHTHDSTSWRVLAEMQSRTGNPAGARKSLERAVALEPERAQTLGLLGITLIKLDRLREAETLFRRALQLDRTAVDAWVNLASCLRLQNRVWAAAEALRQAAELNPDDAEIWLSLGRSLQAAARDREAADAFRKAAVMAPGRLEPRILEASTMVTNGRFDDGLAIARAAARDFPQNPAAQCALADLLRTLGRLDDAAKAYRKALDLAPDDATAILGLSHVARPEPDDPIVLRAAALFKEPSTAPRSRMILAFALGGILEQQGGYQTAFERYLEGNRLKRQTIDFSLSQVEREAERAKTVSQYLKPCERAGSPRPILIVGMPRAGTTLVEQILASHPAVAAGAELPLLRRLVLDLPDLTGVEQAYPEALGSMTAAQHELCAAVYRDGLAAHAGGRAIVTDKAPLNFRYLGWAAALLPDARIVHCVRDPMDTCVSCFSRLFGDGRVEFSYGLEDLGAFYRLYRSLMSHWHDVLPGRIMDLSYESLVADQEAVSRRLLAFCGLEWTPRVLAFHRTRRAVETASASQVRTPIYASSIGRWRRYEAFLDPLKSALGPLGPG